MDPLKQKFIEKASALRTEVRAILKCTKSQAQSALETSMSRVLSGGLTSFVIAFQRSRG